MNDEQTRYEDRAAAGRDLARRLTEYTGRDDVVVLGLTRGGVPVAFEIAGALRAPLDVMVVRKLGVPGHEELAFGAIACGGHRVLNKEMMAGLNLSEACVDEIIAREGVEIERRLRLYNRSFKHECLTDKTVILIDDGLATGATMEAAVKSVRAQRPKEVVVAAPVAPLGACEQFTKDGDVKCICARTFEPFYAIGLYYVDFAETSDDDVIELLGRSRDLKAVQKEVVPTGGAT